MNILFRCDGSINIGMGHVIRCLALADELQESYGCNVHFAMRQSELGINKVKETFTVLESNEEAFDYKNWLVDCIQKTNAVILIMDMRDGLTREQLKQIKKKSGIKLVTIDDPEEKCLAADLAFYPPIPQVRSMNLDDMYGEWFSGWEYVIIDPRFRDACTNIHERKNNSILVSMGWSDPAGLTVKVVDALNKINKSLQITVLLGQGSKWYQILESQIQRSHHKIALVKNPSNRAEIMAKNELAICSFGVTAYELLTLSVPSIILSLSNDHKVSASIIEKMGAGLNLGVLKGIEGRELVLLVENLLFNKEELSNMNDKAGAVPIGDGVFTIANTIMNNLN